VSWFSLHFCLIYFSFYEELTKIWSKIYIGLHTKYPIFSTHFIGTWIFLTGIRKIHEFQISGKSVQWEPFVPRGRRDGQTVLTNLTGSFRNSVNPPYKGVYNEHIRSLLFSNTMRLHRLRTQTRSIKIEGTLLKLGSLKRKIKHKTDQTKRKWPRH